jgi:hypothetical protein
MKTFSNYSEVPRPNIYLGSEDGGGGMTETLADLIAEAAHPMRIREEDGTFSYFDLDHGQSYTTNMQE